MKNQIQKTTNSVSQHHGWLIIDKPLNMTSARVVSRVKRILGVKKVGHAGTLDPLASGILPIAVGEATKTVSYVMNDEKAYEFEVEWGAQTSTDDLEGEAIYTSDKRPSIDEIEYVLSGFLGEIQQKPPIFSAIKIDGKRSYSAARAGHEFDLPARAVQIHKLEIVENVQSERTSFYVECGKGTYVRSIARDLGLKLGCYGFVSRLRRVKVGKFQEKCAISLEKLEKLVHNRESCMMSIQQVLDDIPAVVVSDAQEILLRQGRTLQQDSDQQTVQQQTILCVNDDRAIALATRSEDGIKPFKVFNI